MPSWVWEMEVGESVSIDERGRIMIPAEIRRKIKNKTFKVEAIDKDTILLSAVREGEELANQIQTIKLTGDTTRSTIDAAEIKDSFGGMKD